MGTTSVGTINLNEEDWIIGEVVKGSKSGVTGIVASVTDGDRDLTDFYRLLLPNIGGMEPLARQQSSKGTHIFLQS